MWKIDHGYHNQKNGSFLVIPKSLKFEKKKKVGVYFFKSVRMYTPC